MAIKHKTHIDTVLAYREQYLQEVGCQETLQQFMQYAGKVTYVHMHNNNFRAVGASQAYLYHV